MLDEKIIQLKQSMIAVEEQIKKTEHLLKQNQISIKNLEKKLYK